VGGGGGIFLEKESRLTRRPYGNTLELPELETLLKLYHMPSGSDWGKRTIASTLSAKSRFRGFS